MPLDPEVRGVLSKLARAGFGELSEHSVDELRKAASTLRLPEGPRAVVTEHRMAGPGGELMLHAYRPEVAAPLLGGLVFLGGAGFVVDALSGEDALCRRLAIDAQCVVVAVRCRTAPEHRFPAAVDDAYAATCFVHEHADLFGIDHTRLAIGGQSSGATLAASVSRLAKERRNPALVFQLLLYPITDLRMHDVTATETPMRELLLSHASLNWLADLYVRGPEDRTDPRCSPLLAKNLIGLPPALIISAEFDAACEQAQAYAAGLSAAHVPVTLSRYPGMVHGFVHLHALLDGGRAALAQCSRALQEALADHSASR
jgi:acetyl esterase